MIYVFTVSDLWVVVIDVLPNGRVVGIYRWEDTVVQSSRSKSDRSPQSQEQPEKRSKPFNQNGKKQFGRGGKK